MSSGYAGAHADVIEFEGKGSVLEIVTDPGLEFENAVKKSDLGSIEEFARCVEQGDEIEDGDVIEAWNNLKTSFFLKTGLDLGIGYHDSDNSGDCYDEVNGVYFFVEGCYQKSPAMEQFEKKYGEGVIAHRSFVQLG